MHAKFGRRREHARGAPNRINHIPAADSVNVISDQHRKWMNKTEKVVPFCSSKPEVQQTSIRPYTLPPTNMFWASPCLYRVPVFSISSANSFRGFSNTDVNKMCMHACLLINPDCALCRLVPLTPLAMVEPISPHASRRSCAHPPGETHILPFEQG